MQLFAKFQKHLLWFQRHVKEFSETNSCILSHLLQFDKKWRSTNSIYKLSKLKLSMFRTGYTVAMVTYYAIKIATIGSPMAGHLCDTNVASHDEHQ